MNEKSLITIQKDGSDKYIRIEQLEGKKLPQLFVCEGNEAVLAATFQNWDKAEEFVHLIEDLCLKK